LEWKFGQRSNLQEINSRGIISDEYINVVRGDKDIDKANDEIKINKKSMVKNLNKKFEKKLRPSMSDLELRGLVPHGIFENPDTAIQEMEDYKTKTKNSFVTRFNQRMMPEEAITRNIIERDYLSKDLDIVEKKKRRRME